MFDDASNDGTSDVVRSYAEQYPEIVVPFIHSENRHSKGLEADDGFLDLAKGDLIAFCEGDDYWCSEYKLQKQFDFMVAHPECTLCTHSVAEFDDKIQKVVAIRMVSDCECDVKLEQILFEFTSFGTNSMMYRRNDHSLPEAFNGWGVGDYPRFIYSALDGVVHFMPEVMSVYRTNVAGSWTKRNGTADKKCHSTALITEGLIAADEYSDREYSELFARAAYLQKRDCLLARREWRELTRGDTATFFHEDPFRKKAIAWVRCFLPDAVVRFLVDASKRDFRQRKIR